LNKKKYSSAIKKTPFNYLKTKIIGRLILQGLDRNEVYNECYDNNYLGIDSLQRRREVTNVIYERLVQLDQLLLGEFVNGDINTSKFVLVYAIAKNDPLFFDFLFEVYRESLLNEKGYISIDDFDLFFKVKKEINITVSKWGHHTIDCLAKGYRNILVESGLGNREKKNIRTVKPIIHPDIIEHIKHLGDKHYMKAILGEM